MSSTILSMETLLDRAKIVSWSQDALVVHVPGGIAGLAIEITDHDGIMQLRHSVARVVRSDTPIPIIEIEDQTLARLPHRARLWTDSAEGTLDLVRRVMHAHVRLRVVYPPLLLDAVVRAFPDVVVEPGTAVSCSFTDDTCCAWLVFDNETTGFTLRDPVIVRATSLLTHVDWHKAWVPFIDDPTDTPLSRVPEPHATGHLALQHQELLHGYRHELEHHILPVLGA